MKKLYIILLLAGITFSGMSCHKFLDQQPNSQATDQTTWQTESDANAAVAACYSLIRSAFNTAITYYAYGDLPSDEFTQVVGGDGSFTDVQDMNWGIGIPPANTYDPRLKLRLYTNFYTAIAQSNRCLYFINNMPNSVFTNNGDDAASEQAEKNRYLGEAYFTRAFCYFYIARVWGDVPLVTTYQADNSTAPQLPRTAQKTILAQAISDLGLARQYLNWQDPSSTDRVVRADKGAVFALLAHLYAWQGDYANCNSACDSVINSGSYTMVPASEYLSIYKGQSSEGIFEIAQNSGSEGIIATGLWTITNVTLVEPYLTTTATQPGWEISTSLFGYLFSDTTDLRYKNAFVNVSSGGSTAIECIKYSTIQNVNNNTTYQEALSNIIVFRLADILLLKAEALTAGPAQDYGTAMSLVNQVRSRAGLTTMVSGLSGNDLLNAITDERGRELFLEGHRFYDLIRNERVTGVQQLPYVTTDEFTAGMYYWPVDPTLFLTNSNLTQTPFWQGKVSD